MMINDNALDERLIEKIKMRIIILENYNRRKQEFSYTKMVEKIKQIIEEEVECLLNQ